MEKLNSIKPGTTSWYLNRTGIGSYLMKNGFREVYSIIQNTLIYIMTSALIRRIPSKCNLIVTGSSRRSNFSENWETISFLEGESTIHPTETFILSVKMKLWANQINSTLDSRPFFLWIPGIIYYPLQLEDIWSWTILLIPDHPYLLRLTWIFGDTSPGEKMTPRF